MKVKNKKVAKKSEKVAKKSNYKIEVGGPFTKTVLIKRIKILKEGIEVGAYKEDDLKKARRRLSHYKYHLAVLREA